MFKSILQWFFFYKKNKFYFKIVILNISLLYYNFFNIKVRKKLKFESIFIFLKLFLKKLYDFTIFQSLIMYIYVIGKT